MERPLVWLGCSVLVACLAVLTPVATAGAPTGADAGQPHRPAVPDAEVRNPSPDQAGETAALPLEPDRVVVRVAVYENGTAEWRVEYWVRLDDPRTEAAFQRYRRDVEANRTAAASAFADRIRPSVATAAEATGREMAATDFAVDPAVRRIPRAYGVVAHTFRWHGFASVEDRRIEVGDALAGFLLEADERLLVSWPDGYDLAEARPSPDERREGAVVWSGPTAFGPDEPRVVLTERPGPPTHVLAGAAVALLLVVALGLAARRSDRADLPLPARLGGESDDADLLSNEERVLRLLERHGGRLKQGDVADELGWTSTKTSYVVSKLREEGRIRSFRLGRENVLTLSDRDDPGGPQA